jgi:hypothetical protein
MKNDFVNESELALRAGIARRRAKSAARATRQSFRDNGERVLTQEAAGKIIARARFSQRMERRANKLLTEAADALRPRVAIDMPARRSDDREAGR